jgi:integrase
MPDTNFQNGPLNGPRSAAGVPGSAHGVRKLAATTMANNGATDAQLEAVFGWTGRTMASLYTRKANRRRLALGAMHLMANDSGTSMPAPLHPVRAGKEKAQ